MRLSHLLTDSKFILVFGTYYRPDLQLPTCLVCRELILFCNDQPKLSSLPTIPPVETSTNTYPIAMHVPIRPLVSTSSPAPPCMDHHQTIVPSPSPVNSAISAVEQRLSIPRNSDKFCSISGRADIVYPKQLR